MPTRARHSEDRGEHDARAEEPLLTAAERAALHDPALVLPFANLRTATGERKKTGLANSLVAPDPVRPTPTGRIVVFPNSVVFTGTFFKHPAGEDAEPLRRSA